LHIIEKCILASRLALFMFLLVRDVKVVLHTRIRKVVTAVVWMLCMQGLCNLR